MKTTISAGALILFATLAQANKEAHQQLELLHRRHREQRLAQRNETELKKRGTCAFPTDAGLVAVTPGSQNAGWAMSPDQPCLPNSFCPYACPAGMVSMQWDPSVTSYTYPGSMNGGLKCDSNGQISKPFPDKPYCQKTPTNIGVINKMSGPLSFCQTVLPGNENMLIPTDISDSATLAVPGMDYWASTAAHYYIANVDSSKNCAWGSSSNPYGNWAPYVAGTNVDASGTTFIKLGWNPIYLEPTCPFKTKMPSYGVEIQCPNGGCNGLPCAIDPSSNNVNQMNGGSTSGAGGGNFCVVTVAKGSKANFVVTGQSSGQSSNNKQWVGGQFYQSSAAPSSSAAVSTTTSSSSSASTTVSSSSNSTTTQQYSSWSANTSTSYSKPTGAPHYQLFNTTTPETATAAAAASTLAQPSNPIATHTGSAARLGLSVLAFVPALLTLI